MFSFNFLNKYSNFLSARAFTALAIALLAVSATPAKPAQALACAAIANGSWNVTTTWSCGVVPGISDSVTIGVPFTITLTGNESAMNVTIGNGGTLALASFTLTLSSASIGMTVSNGGNLNTGTGIVNDNAAGAAFLLASGGTLQTANPQGIATGVVLTGSIQTRGLRTYSTGASYIYNGTANQAVGNGLTQNTPANLTVNNPGNIVSLGAPTSISGNLILTAGTLNLAANATTVGSIQGTGNTTSDLAGAVTLTTGSNNASTVYSGVISNGSGAVALTKVGTGALTLGGNNTYSGTTTLSAGTLNINNATAIGAGTFIISAGTINNTSGAAITLSNNNPMNWNGNFTFTGTNPLNLGTGAVTLNANRTATVTASTLTVGGIIGGAFRLTKAGNGILTLNAANTYGGTTLAAGRINIGNSQALGNIASTFIINGGTIDNTIGAALTLLNYPYTIGGNFTFAGTNNLNLGTGTITLTGNRTITVTANTLIVDGVIGGTFGMTKAGNGLLTLNAANTHSGTTLTAGTLNIGNAQALGNIANVFIINGGSINNTTGAALTLSNYSYTVGGNFTFVGTNNLNLGNGPVTLTGNRTITVTANTLTVNGVIGGAFRLTKAGVGTLTLSGANTFTGTTLSAGILNINNAQALGAVGGAFIITAGTIDNTSGATITTLNYPQNWNGNFTFSGTNALNLGVGTVTMNAARTVTTTANTLTVGGVIGGAFRLTKAGAGALTLSGANIFTGTTLSAGTLNINNAQALGAVGSAFIITAGTIDNTSGATITTLNYPQNWNGDFTFTGANSLNMGNGAVAMNANRTVTINGNTLTVGGVISGAARRLTKAGAGALTLSGVNTFTGGTTLTAGILNINNAQALGTVAGTFIINSGTIDNTSGVAITMLNYPQTWGGNFIFTGTNALNLGTGAVTLSASRTVTINANTLTVGGTVSPNTTDLTKAGVGTLSFGINAVNLRNLVISAGTLISSSGTTNLAGSFTNSSVFTHNNGTVNFNGAAAQSINGVTTFNNLALSNANGLTINANETINSVLTFTNGKITTGANTLIIETSGSISGANAARYVNGFVQKNFPVAAGQSFSFPIGNAASYAPVDTTGLTVTTTGGIIASTTTGEHPNIATSNVDPAKDVNRYWTLTPAGGIVFSLSYSATFNFAPGDIDSAATTGNFIVNKYSSGWSSPVIGTRTATNTQAISIPTLGDFAVGEVGSFPPTITSPTPPAGIVNNNAYTHVYNATGTTPITYSLTLGSLPPGLTLTPAGTLAGTPTTAGTYSGIVTATNGIVPVSTQNFSITINPANTTTTITNDAPDSSVVGEAVTINFTVTGAFTNLPTVPTGNVTVSDGIQSCTAAIAVGACSITFTTAGIKSLTATYVGDTNFNGSSSNIESHTVNTADTTTVITNDLPDPSIYGQTVPINFTVTASTPGSGIPTGTVTVTDGVYSCTSAVSTGTCNIVFMTVGAKTLTATYIGDTNFNTSMSVGEPHQVDKADATIVVTPYNVTYDGSSHTATGSATGVLGESLSGLDLSGTTHTNAGTYNGDPWTFTDVTGNYNDDNGTVNDQIGQASSTVIVTCPVSEVYTGSAITPCTAEATGTGMSPVDVSASLIYSNNINVGTATANASWAGDADHTSSANSSNFAISKANVTIVVTPYNISYDGSSHTATGSATGILGESLGGLDLSSTTHTNAGTYNSDPWTFTDITGNYNDDNGTINDQINQASSTVTVTCPASQVYTGFAITPCTAEATGAGMGLVDVSASLVYSNNTDVGAATANASWTGDANHTGNTGSGGFTIGQASSTVTVTCPASVSYNGLAQTPCTAEATGAGMSPVDVSASLVYSNNINVGASTVNASWGGDVNHTGNTGSGGFTIGQATQTITVVTGAPTSASNGSTFDVSATATSGLLVTITTTGNCSGGDTDGDATITMTSGSGTCVVSYDQAGDSNYSAAPQVQESVNATEGPAFTSANNTSFDVGFPGSFTVTAIGNPSTMTIVSAGTLPTGVTFTDNGDGSALLAGTPTVGTNGTYNLVFTADNGVLPTATQNFTLTIRNGPIVVPNGVNSIPDTGNGNVSENESILDTLGITKLTVQFSQDVNDPLGNSDIKDVTNPANYMLVRSTTTSFATIDCKGGVVAPDISISVDSVAYSDGTPSGTGPFVSTLSVNSGLPLNVAGFYRLYVCGTTSIVDAVNTNLILAGNGTTSGTDFQRNFQITTTATGGGGGGGGTSTASVTRVTSNFLIPVTGFTPNQITALPAQPADKIYAALGQMTIEIPTLGINFPIVGAPITDKTWDLTWLQNSVAYLEGSAYPTLPGNTVLTAHVRDAANNLGPFSDIKWMEAGQKIFIHANGLTYVYQVQENQKILPSSISKVFKHEMDDWITLLTCEDYNTKTGLYTSRRMVRAVLISVIPEK